MTWIVLVLKWLAQLIILVSSVSALFHDLFQTDPATSRRRLTGRGWLHLSGLAVGFVLFGVTEIDQWQRAGEERREREAQIRSLKSVEDVLRGQVEAGRRLADAQDLVIRNQSAQNAQLQHLLLASYELAGFEVSLGPLSPMRPATLMALEREVPPALKGTDLAYFKTCLEHAAVVGRHGASGHWTLECTLGRPQGVITPTFEAAPGSFEARAIERYLDQIFTRHFSIRFEDGSDLLMLGPRDRPPEFRRTGRDLVLRLGHPPIKLSRLMGARLVLRIDVDRVQEAPRYIRLRSLDPLAAFDQTFSPRWERRKYGTTTRVRDPGDEPEVVGLYASMAGPLPLAVRFDERLVAGMQTLRPSSH